MVVRLPAARRSFAPTRCGRAFGTLRGAARRDLARMVGITLIVTTLLTVADAVLDEVVTPHRTAASVASEAASLGLDLFLVSLLAGFFVRSVGSSGHGLPDDDLWDIVRTQPYVRLVAADFLSALLTVIGLLLWSSVRSQRIGLDASAMVWAVRRPCTAGSPGQGDRRPVDESNRRSNSPCRGRRWFEVSREGVVPSQATLASTRAGGAAHVSKPFTL